MAALPLHGMTWVPRALWCSSPTPPPRGPHPSSSPDCFLPCPLTSGPSLQLEGSLNQYLTTHLIFDAVAGGHHGSSRRQQQ